jgi:hypothetical protein
MPSRSSSRRLVSGKRAVGSVPRSDAPVAVSSSMYAGRSSGSPSSPAPPPVALHHLVVAPGRGAGGHPPPLYAMLCNVSSALRGAPRPDGGCQKHGCLRPLSQAASCALGTSVVHSRRGGVRSPATGHVHARRAAAPGSGRCSPSPGEYAKSVGVSAPALRPRETPPHSLVDTLTSNRSNHDWWA